MTKKEAQLNALRKLNEGFTPEQLRMMEAQRHFATTPEVPSKGVSSRREAEVKAAGTIASMLSQVLETADPITQITRGVGQVAGLSPEDQQALELVAGSFTPGPGELATAGKIGLGKGGAALANVFMFPSAPTTKRALKAIKEKWLRMGEEAVKAGDPETLTQVIESLTGLDRTLKEQTALRQAAARYLKPARTTVFKKGTPLGEALREALYVRGPGGSVRLQPSTENVFQPYVREPGGVIGLTPETIGMPAGVPGFGHEMGEVFQNALQKKGSEDLTRMLEEAASRQTFRDPESEQALSLLSRHLGVERGEALRVAREMPAGVKEIVRTGRPHGAAPEDWTREATADLLSQLTSATGQAKLSDAQIRALRGQVGLLLPQP